MREIGNLTHSIPSCQNLIGGIRKAVPPMRVLCLMMVTLVVFAGCNRQTATAVSAPTTAPATAPVTTTNTTPGQRPQELPSKDYRESGELGDEDRPEVEEKPAGRASPLRMDRQKTPPPAKAKPKPAGQTGVAEAFIKIKAQPDLVRFQKTACYGNCKQYTMTIDATGRAELRPRNGFRDTLTKVMTLPMFDARDLKELIDATNVTELADFYPQDKPIIADFQRTLIDLAGEDGEPRRITVVSDAPKALANLIESLEKLATESDFWIKKN